jgi:hypothetical protein
MSQPEIGTKIYELADKIAQDALGSEDPAARLDAFKALTQFYIGTTRLSGRMRDEEDGVGRSIAEMRASINDAGQAVPKARRDRNGKHA